jgi:hypothetical protein
MIGLAVSEGRGAGKRLTAFCPNALLARFGRGRELDVAVDRGVTAPPYTTCRHRPVDVLLLDALVRCHPIGPIRCLGQRGAHMTRVMFCATCIRQHVARKVTSTQCHGSG